MVPAVAYATPTRPLSSEVSTTLTVSGGVAYEIFSDALEIPRWLPIVQTARRIRTARCGNGHPGFRG